MVLPPNGGDDADDDDDDDEVKARHRGWLVEMEMCSAQGLPHINTQDDTDDCKADADARSRRT